MHNELVDSFGRKIDYLRLSVIEQCNLNCFYCNPGKTSCDSGSNPRLSSEQLIRLVRIWSELGVRKVRLTGGEPLLRKNIVEIAAAIAELPGIEDLSLSTNAYLLEQKAEQLAKAGVRRINVSLDSLNKDNFFGITGGGDLQRVLRGIERAREVGLNPVKINMVAMQGVNDHEIDAMIDFAHERDLNLRFIETMPLGGFDGEQQINKYYYPAESLLAHIRERFGCDLIPVRAGIGAGPASYYKIGEHPMTVGVITAMSRHFCETCNRVRLNANGELFSCLAQTQKISFADLLARGATDDELRELALAAIKTKPRQHDFLRRDNSQHVEMVAIGG